MKLKSELAIFMFLCFFLKVKLTVTSNIYGMECDTYFGAHGKCMNVKACSTLMINHKNYTEQKHTLLNSICNFENGKLYVCCPSKNHTNISNHDQTTNNSLQNCTNNNTKDYPLPVRMIEDEYLNDNFINKFIKNSSQFLTRPPSCGQSFHEETRHSITLGEIRKGQYPWIGTVGEISDEEEIEISQVTLITKRHVLSTAHTIYTALENYIKLNYVWFSINTYENDTEEVYRIPISDVLIHPEFNNSYYTNDIALIKLQFEVNHPYLQPICLPTIPALSSVVYDGLKAILYTLMDSINAETNEIIKSVERTHYVQIISKQKCIEQYGNGWRVTIETSTICTKRIYPNDFCSYVGSPLMLPFVNTNGDGVSYYLLGFRITGRDVCTKNSNYPQIHLRVADYLNWIENYILY